MNSVLWLLYILLKKKHLSTKVLHLKMFELSVKFLSIYFFDQQNKAVDCHRGIVLPQPTFRDAINTMSICLFFLFLFLLLNA